MQEVRTLEVKCDFLNVVKVDTRCNNMMLITSVDGLINWAWTHRVHCNQLYFYLQLSIQWMQRGKIRLPLKQSTCEGGVAPSVSQIGSTQQCSWPQRHFKDFIYNIICPIIEVKAKVFLVWLKSSGFVCNYTDIPWNPRKMTTAVTLQVKNLHHVRKQKYAGFMEWNNDLCS